MLASYGIGPQGVGFYIMVLVVGLGLAGLKTPLAFALPLMLMGIGHGLLMPPALAGVSQQFTGALGAYFVGLVPHDGAVNLGLLMRAFMLSAVCAQVVLHRR